MWTGRAPDVGDRSVVVDNENRTSDPIVAIRTPTERKRVPAKTEGAGRPPAGPRTRPGSIARRLPAIAPLAGCHRAEATDVRKAKSTGSEDSPAILLEMDDLRFGSAVRGIRIRRRLRQEDLARLAGISRATVSRIERGHLASLSVDTLRAVAAVLEIRVDLTVRWRGGELDRLLNARHSRLHELVARRFAALDGWVVRPETSFAISGERGVIDLLAFHRRSNSVLVVELKTEIVDVNALIGTVDRKRRHGVRVAADQGWPVGATSLVSVWVIVSDSHTNRRRVAAHRAVLRAAFPTDGRSAPGWLLRPSGSIRALSFWPNDQGRNASHDLAAVKRVRRCAMGSATRRPR